MNFTCFKISRSQSNVFWICEKFVQIGRHVYLLSNHTLKSYIFSSRPRREVNQNYSTRKFKLWIFGIYCDVKNKPCATIYSADVEIRVKTTAKYPRGDAYVFTFFSYTSTTKYCDYFWTQNMYCWSKGVNKYLVNFNFNFNVSQTCTVVPSLLKSHSALTSKASVWVNTLSSSPTISCAGSAFVDI